MKAIIQYLSFSVWLISLIIMPWKSIYVVTRGKISLVSWLNNIPLLFKTCNFFIHTSTEGHLRLFPYLRYCYWCCNNKRGAWMHIQLLRCVWFCNSLNCSLPDSSSMEFSRQKYWSRSPFPAPWDLPDPGIETASLMSPALAGEFFTSAPPEKPYLTAGTWKDAQHH